MTFNSTNSCLSGQNKYCSHLDERRVQVDVVGHDDGSDDPHRLLQLHRPTVGTVRYKHPLQQLRLVWLYQHILRTKNSQTCHGAISAVGKISCQQTLHTNYIGNFRRQLPRNQS